MNYNIDNVSYNILNDYLQSNEGYTHDEVNVFLMLDPGRIRDTVERADLRLCDMCHRTIMYEGYLHELNGEVYCEKCVHEYFTVEEREQLYNDDYMFWTEFHGY